jgi:glycosyltransferase involved in cell wall biosynthesis
MKISFLVNHINGGWKPTDTRLGGTEESVVLPHGYDSSKIYPKEKVKNQCLYASSPDRGLDVLEMIWPSVVEKHPDAHLYVTYGGQINGPNVTCGEFTEDEMNDLYNTSDFWVHPCSGGELFGITGVKAQAAGAIPVYFPMMALKETVRHGVKCDGIRDMYEKLTDLMDDQPAKDALRKQLADETYVDWTASTDRLLEIINEVVG